MRLPLFQTSLRATLLLVCMLLPIVAHAEFAGKVVDVIDGDTIDVQHEGTRERIRLNGVDTPEKGQGFGRRAKEFFDDLVKGRDVCVERPGTDKYGRTIGDMFLSAGTHLNKELVKSGLAITPAIEEPSPNWWFGVRFETDQILCGIPENEIVMGEVSVGYCAEVICTIRGWEA